MAPFPVDMCSDEQYNESFVGGKYRYPPGRNDP